MSMLKTKEEMIDWLNNNKIVGYVINEDLSVDVDGNVHLVAMNFSEIPIKFRNVSGNFGCSCNYLTSLNFCPEYVGGDFYCYDNLLVSFIGCPTRIDGGFYCENNNLPEEESFLYEYTYEQIGQYYKNKDLNKDLLVILEEKVEIGFKSKKI